MALRHVMAAAAVFAAAGLALGQNSSGDQPSKNTTRQTTKEKSETKQLSVGDKAPEITVAKFVKGDPVTGFEKGRTYVVEFWATWCGPCKESIPHLTELQKEYKDIKFVGVSVWERDQAKIEPFVKDEGDQMVYSVAADDVPALPDDVKPGTRDAQKFYIANGKMSKNWMSAAGQNGIPTAFIVDGDGKIAYIGHPMWLEIPLAAIAKGTWDPKTGPEQISQIEESLGEIEQGARQGDAKEALEKIDELTKKQPAAAKVVEDARTIALLRTGNPKGEEPARKAIDKAVEQKNPMTLNEIAWAIVNPENEIEHRNLDLAMSAATKAVDLTKRKDPAILDTLAWVYFDQGNKDKAVATEKEALEALDANEQLKNNDQLKDELEGNLKKFQESSGSK